MRLTYLSLIILIVMSSAVDMIFAQFKVIKMESLRSLASSHDHHHHHQAPHIAASAVNEKGKPAMTKDSNVTVIQVLPRERLHRRTDKVIRRRIDAPLASDFKVLTPREPTDAKLMKLHIINVRTGKIQDAIMLAPSSHSNQLDDNHPKAKSVHRASDNSRKKEIIRIQPVHSTKPERIWNEINISKKYQVKPYKLRNKFTSSKCKCEDTARMWNCKKIQISVARCKSTQFICCS